MIYMLLLIRYYFQERFYTILSAINYNTYFSIYMIYLGAYPVKIFYFLIAKNKIIKNINIKIL